ncbi:heat-inducible transcriptional repressor HrcA [Actinomyces sp. B33]|uniref:heat-inducible transcriptional repressor HrcA n=1 Tax=Actinomyces sp. B33 TaxID=2942131 RepID=UPI002341846A|nr:heat-inducible transcriptional repressor HrcA [Actinomyces sp. B33]MDC4232829.1 heat-inducible transcriptional repressor HrcA [Actinomyces sp. B33]
MSEERRLDVLRAIVSEYVHTREPVGSKVIAQSHDLGVSSATIRNDMALLEEAGLIYQPHTSAGRVPTDKGYRVFVDRLSALKPMSAPERRAVESFLARSTDLDEVVTGTVRLLAQVTRQVAVVEYPTPDAQRLRRVEIVEMGPGRLLVIVITEAGLVHERIVEGLDDLDPDDLDDLRTRLNEAGEGLTSDEMRPALDALAAQAPTRVGIPVVVETLLDLMRPAASSRIAIAGISNLARGAVDFRDIAPVLDALEEQVVLMRLFAELDSDEGVRVTIGAENPHDALAQASVVTGTYGASDGPRAHLGVVGPTRMDYARTMSSVRAVAAYLSRYLAH